MSYWPGTFAKLSVKCDESVHKLFSILMSECIMILLRISHLHTTSNASIDISFCDATRINKMH